MVVLAVDDRLERADGILELDELAGNSGEDFRDVERLRQEALDLPRAADGQLILFAELVHAEDGDDVLKALVLLKRRLDRAGGLVMLLADGARLEDAAGGVERVDGRVDAELGNRAAEHGRGVQVGEG